MKLTKTQLKQIIKEELKQVIEEGTLSDMSADFSERLSDWADAAKELGVSLQDLLGSMKHLPGAAGEAAMQALEWLASHTGEAAGDAYDAFADLPGLGPGVEPVRKMLRREK